MKNQEPGHSYATTSHINALEQAAQCTTWYRQRVKISNLELRSFISLLAHAEDTYHHIILRLIYLSSQNRGEMIFKAAEFVTITVSPELIIWIILLEKCPDICLVSKHPPMWTLVCHWSSITPRHLFIQDAWAFSHWGLAYPTSLWSWTEWCLLSRHRCGT